MPPILIAKHFSTPNNVKINRRKSFPNVYWNHINHLNTNGSADIDFMNEIRLYVSCVNVPVRPLAAEKKQEEEEEEEAEHASAA